MVSVPPEPGKVKLLDRVREAMRFKHYSLRTEPTYIDWIKRFIIYHGKRHPETMGVDEVRRFLNNLASERNVAASTQNQAFSALLFLYKEVLKQQSIREQTVQLRRFSRAEDEIVAAAPRAAGLRRGVAATSGVAIVNMQQREWNHRTGHQATRKKVRPLTRRVDAAAEIKVEARENREKRWQLTVESRRFSSDAASGIRSTVPFLPRARD